MKLFWKTSICLEDKKTYIFAHMSVYLGGGLKALADISAKNANNFCSAPLISFQKRTLGSTANLILISDDCVFLSLKKVADLVYF